MADLETAASQPMARSPFAWPDFRALFITTASATFASRALAVVMGYKVYELTRQPFALGMLGLVEAIPALSLALYGGHIADRRERRSILRVTLASLVVCSASLATLEALDVGRWELTLLYAIVFIAGIARGFAEPAAGALEAQVVPRALLVNSSTLMASCWLSAAVAGPLVAGIVYAKLGAIAAFGGIAILYGIAWVAVHFLTPKPVPIAPAGESIWQSVAVGVRYVLGDQILLGSMALDLFAVLFGGAIALLPVFAKDILHVGPVELGMLNAAPTSGALFTMLIATRYPPIRHAGRNLLVAVAGFGIAMIVFALSTSLWLSIVALFISGVCDGVSVVIRRAIMRLMSPDHLRGRIAAVGMIFIGSSNELGAFESGVAASLVGTARSVWIGAIVTLMIVAGAAISAPKLRRLDLTKEVGPNRREDNDSLA